MPKKAILCVDDEEIVLTALREQLQDYFGEQYRYELAESAFDAMEVMEELAQEGVEVVSRFLCLS
jgi:CheY-like chemotaxis protein